MRLRLEEHKPLPLQEYPGLKELLLQKIEGTGGTGSFLADVRLMGITYDPPYAQFLTSYYVGADWIDKKKGISAVVYPKIKGIDFQTMLMKCFQSSKACENLDAVFCIRTEDQPIEVSSQDFQIEPLLVVYFMNLVQNIVKKGLKQDYILREERLDGRIKGKILFNRYINRGVAIGRRDQVNCRYQEYCIDCLDNRIIKAALLLCRDIILRNHDELGIHATALDSMYANAAAAFQNVSSDVSLQDLHRVHVHPMYKEYRAIMPLAKMIIRKQGYCVGQSDKNGSQMFPPFIINMPILFERYVYSLLLERYDEPTIRYQVPVPGNILDFTKADEKMILDTKYITDWETSINHENVRQLSGYARHHKVRMKLGVPDDTFICPCVIIYPSITGLTTFSTLPDKLLTPTDSPILRPIPEYVNFYKLSVKLPTR